MLQRTSNKIIAMICILVLASCFNSLPVGAVAVQDTGKVNLIINNNLITFLPDDQVPVIITGRTYVPLRVVSENLGAQIEWKPDSQQVFINWQKKSIDTIPANNDKNVQIIIDGQVLIIPDDLGKAYISKLGRTMIPLRAVVEALNCEVNWNNGTVDITSTPAAVTEPENVAPIVETPTETITKKPTELDTIQKIDEALNIQLLKNLAAYRTNLKLMDGSVINSEELLNRTPSSFSSEQLLVLKTYLEQVGKYQPSIKLPDGQIINTADMTILGNAYLTAQQLEKWMQSDTPRITAKMAAQGQPFKEIPDLAELYIRIGTEYGIRGDLAFCQAAKETGYWQFTGSVQPWQNNYCGLWATGSPLSGQESFNGADPNQVCFQAGTHGAIFITPEAGVEAHIQHLYAYATNKPLPAGKVLIDPRFSLVNKGIGPTWQKLNARWAVPGTTYGQSIIYDYWLKAADN